MRSNNHSVQMILAAGFGLALALTFSCSSDYGDAGGGQSSSVVQSSSSDVANSSSDASSSSSDVANSSSDASSSSVLRECEDIFNPANKFCYDGIVYDKCGGQTYDNPADKFCYDGAVYDKCDDMEYNPSTYICSGDLAIPARCNGEGYNPLTHYCSNGTVVTYGFVTYEGKTYKTVEIGTQTWMAENLNYNVNGSKCYENNALYCDKYGRLYNWTTAMTSPSCNSIACVSQVSGAKHRGICPSGWHIPNDSDWDVLMNAVGGSPTAGTKLKAATGWNTGSGYIAGTNYYGFSALPGGYGNSDGSFSGISSEGGWWSTENGSGDAAGGIADIIGGTIYALGIHYNAGNAYWDLKNKINYFSVRCLKDN
jgi:uncharacterized protein (TIGR02145 family)